MTGTASPTQAVPAPRRRVDVASVLLEGRAFIALIVLIRTFLSWSLEVEISGRWPWQKESDTGAGSDSGESAEPARAGA